MASRDSPVATDKQVLPSARPLPIPRNRDRQPLVGDESAMDMTQGSADSSRTTSSSLSSYPTARAAMASRIASGPGRNTSIDSIMSSASAASGAPSSLSNVSHSHNSSTDTTIAPGLDPTSFIETNGGSIAAVEKLLKERQQLVARTEQLWRLLEKQRHMVHGMHADLEKALKDKERYRRRVKEVEEELDRAVNTLPRSSTALRSSPPSSAAKFGVNGVRTSHGKAGSLDYVSSTTSAVPPSPSSTFPKPTRAATDSIVGHGAHPHSARLPPSTPVDPLVNAPRSAPLHVEPHPSTPLTATISQAKTATPGSAEKSRKAAPAPLNLVRPESSQQAVKGDSDSEDDSDTDVEIREPERGRKRTRAEDDRHRQALAEAEEMRSLSNLLRSKKSKKSLAAAAEEDAAKIALPMSPPLPQQARRSDPMGFDEPVLGSAELPAGMIAGIGLPSSPRAAIDGDMQLPIQSNASPSIASVLGGPDVHTSTTHQTTTVTLPPKSPGLPMSPRPSDRPSNAAMPRVMSQSMAASGPMSPTGLPLSPRAPKYAVPMPESNHSISAALASPQRPMHTTSAPDVISMAERLQQSQGPTFGTAPTSHQNSSVDSFSPKGASRGYTADHDHDLLLAPNALSSVKFKVYSSRLTAPKSGTSSNSRLVDDETVFTLGIHSRSDSKQLWRVEKSPSTLPMLDAALRKEIRLIAPLPERKLFSGQSPATLDQRRAAINAYFDGILDSRLTERAAEIICRYFSSDVLGPDNEARAENPAVEGGFQSPRTSLHKAGWLAKKGKQFGGWKSRWFVLDKEQLRHFAAPGGEHLGNIRLVNAQIAMRNKEVDVDDEFRHYFTLLEPKRRDSTNTTRHVLCAESDEERDQWVNAILTNIANAKNTVASPPTSPSATQVRSQSFTNGPPPAFGPRKQRTQDSIESAGPSTLRAVGYEDTVPADPPMLGTPMMGTPSIISTVPSPLPMEQSASASNSNISGPQDAHPIPNSELSIWNKKASSPSRTKEKDKKRSMFGFMRGSNDESSSAAHRLVRGISPRPQAVLERPSTGKPIFGMPVAEAAELAAPANTNVYLPTPVYRCIQYLEFRGAATEEGIFRLSGSTTVVNDLKARFDSEGDIDLVRTDYLDIHAVSSLLKRYLRELPEPILTKELHPKFAQLSDIEDRQKRLLAVNWLVHKLPEANREVLVALFGFLIKVVNNSDRNKMNVKNVGIVFAPTLHIPTPLVAAFITDHETCFTPSPLDPRSAQQTVDDLGDIALPAGIDELSASRRQILGSMNVSTPNSAGGTGPLNSPDPNSRVAGSFGEVGAPRSLSETRRELRKATGSNDLKDMISRPIPATTPSSAAKQSRSRSRGSPSPGSKNFISPPLSVKATPPPRDDASGILAYNPMTQSSAASSPGSYPSAARAQDGFSTENQASSSRKSKRESTIQALPSFTKPSAAFDSPTHEARKKSSYTRLRENVSNIGSLKEG